LRVKEIQVRGNNAWISLANPDTVLDFLELTNGTTAVLADTTLGPGSYSQLRIVVADSNEIVVDGQSFPLLIPSGTATGVKIVNISFSVDSGECAEIYLDFDIAKSVRLDQGQYFLQPCFRAFSKSLSGTVSGKVEDTLGKGVTNALVQALAGTDTVSTFTRSNGWYELILKQGTYTVTAVSENYAQSDTVYGDISIAPAENARGYNFVLGN
jgi:hypothetical protein